MQLPNPKELKALLKVCRDFGVEAVEVGELKIKFGDLPQKEVVEAVATEAMPSDDDLLYWSTQPDPLEARREAEQ